MVYIHTSKQNIHTHNKSLERRWVSGEMTQRTGCYSRGPWLSLASGSDLAGATREQRKDKHTQTCAQKSWDGCSVLDLQEDANHYTTQPRNPVCLFRVPELRGRFALWLEKAGQLSQ